MTQRAIIYCRVSTKEQVANLSLPVQQRACLDYCERQGISIARVFVEEGESAKTADRPELQAMLSYCRQQRGSIQYLVVYTVDRLARNSYDHAVIRRHLASLGITLRAASQPIDDSPTGKAMEGMLSVFAQLDNDLKAVKVKEGMQEAARRGQWVWRSPLGYFHATRVEGGRTMIKDPQRAPLIAKAFELVASRLHTLTSALESVTELGLRNAHGERLILQTFKQILTNPTYCGRIVIPVWGLDVEGNFEALVDPDTWWRVQSVLSGGTTTITPHLRNRPDFPLRGFVSCGKCRRPLTASWSTGRQGRKYGYYHCPSTARCKATKIRREDLEEDFTNLLADLRPQPEHLALFRAVVLDVWQSQQEEVVARRAALEAELREIKRRRDRLVEVYVYQQGLSEDVYQEQVAKLSEAQSIAQMRLHDAEVEELDIEAVLAFAEHLALHADRMWIAASLDQRQTLQKALYPQGIRTRENRLVRTAPSLLLFNTWEQPASPGEGWCALEDSNL
jgi:site-specific DNA recombinase